MRTSLGFFVVGTWEIVLPKRKDVKTLGAFVSLDIVTIGDRPDFFASHAKNWSTTI